MLQTTNPFQHWRRITTDRKVEQTEPVRYPSMENTLKVFVILRAYVWVVRPPILVNESLLTNTERAPGNRVAKYRARPQAARRYAA